MVLKTIFYIGILSPEEEVCNIVDCAKACLCITSCRNIFPPCSVKSKDEKDPNTVS